MSSALLVLVLAYAMNLVWAGVAAVMAMSAGTALTVSALAAISVYAPRDPGAGARAHCGGDEGAL